MLSIGTYIGRFIGKELSEAFDTHVDECKIG
jgi:hypothetical protein